MTKLKEETIEQVLYSGTNSQAVYKEIYKVNNVVASITISTDFPNTFGAKVTVLNKETGNWNELYTLHKSLLNVNKEPSYNYHYESSQLEREKDRLIKKFSKDVSQLKDMVVKLLF